MPSSASLADYRAALTTPGAAAPALGSALTRLPVAMIGLAALFYVQRTTGSFAIAGAVTAAALTGVSAGAVVQGRLVDRFGPTRPLLSICVLFAAALAGMIAVVEANASAPVLIAVAFVVGVSQPMVGTASRALWGRLLPVGRLRNAALAYESISMEVFFILGPGLAGLLAATSLWPGTGVLVGGAAMVLGAVCFATTPVVRAWRAQPANQRRAFSALGALRSAGMRTLVIAAFGFGVTVGVVEVAVPAAATEAGRPGVGGLLLGLLSFSSVAAGVVYGVRPWPRQLRLRLPAMLLGFSLLLPLLAVPGGLLGLAVVLLMVGVFITPQATTHSMVIEAVAPEGAAAEAFGWVITAITLGLAAGQSSAGTMVELAGPDLAFVVAAVAGVAISAVVWAFRDTIRPPEPESALDAVGAPEPAAAV